MKALSIRQPWAWLIAHGIKTVENRTWPTQFRGRFLIHASQAKPDPGLVAELRKTLADDYPWITTMPEADKFDLGGLVGEATLVDCVTSYDSPFFTGPYGFVLSNAQTLPFRPIPGRLGLFEVTI